MSRPKSELHWYNPSDSTGPSRLSLYLLVSGAKYYNWRGGFQTGWCRLTGSIPNPQRHKDPLFKFFFLTQSFALDLLNFQALQQYHSTQALSNFFVSLRVALLNTPLMRILHANLIAIKWDHMHDAVENRKKKFQENIHKQSLTIVSNASVSYH